jgi:acetylornithine/N-succinyldiaminopimelate aminotransferase
MTTLAVACNHRGMSQADHDRLVAIAAKHLTQNYKQQPIVLSRGQGVRLWDVQDRAFLDMTAGIAVCCLGHAHPGLTRAIAEQAGRLLQVSNLYFGEKQLELAEALTRRSFADRVFFCNSGGEANEAALKCARRYQQVVARAPERITIASMDASFHGRTIATVSITGQEKYRKNFGPMFDPVRFLPFGDLEAARALLETHTICALITEPIQAEGGIVVPPPGYLKALRELCSKTGTLLIFDEVQTGVGRTGTWWGHEHEDCTPDLMTLAKGLAGGVPIGAMLATDEAAKGLLPLAGEPVTHASTFGGNPLACAAALAVIDIIENEGILDNVRVVGEHLDAGLTRLARKYPSVAVESRGRGLLRGLAVKSDPAGLVARCREKGVLLSMAGATVVRFVPALNVSKADLDEALGILDEALAERAAKESK